MRAIFGATGPVEVVLPQRRAADPERVTATALALALLGDADLLARALLGYADSLALVAELSPEGQAAREAAHARYLAARLGVSR